MHGENVHNNNRLQTQKCHPRRKWFKSLSEETEEIVPGNHNRVLERYPDKGEREQSRMLMQSTGTRMMLKKKKKKKK